jgi:hypothetical protein
MARRKGSNAFFAGPGRSALTSRRFDATIEQLTEESIALSLREIQDELQKRYGKRTVPKRTAAKPEIT